jgi:hypothetical protein
MVFLNIIFQNFRLTIVISKHMPMNMTDDTMHF